ncbi:PQQ-dependent sugar dehydrogenase [Flavobacterium sp.]|jgi:glucose/arabinose dehydrogenase|uniref:PQQ-dependent sugar dehydrogenase n=1 Tax=Flavobacterium sp. TaxID=239 RepID=UPI0037C057B0
MKKIILVVITLFIFSVSAQTVAVQTFATGLTNAVAIVHPPADSRLFVVQKTGAIRIVNSNGTVNATPFLTVTGLSSGSEQGLLGLAFHPNYATNGLFFINYTNTAGDTVIARYSVSANPDIANTTATILMTVDQPFSNHNGGSLAFGRDGLLYIGLGDGGSGGDPQGYSQNMTVDPSFPSRVMLGKMLRIDVDTTFGSLNYGIPSTNPYATTAGLREIWAIGLRNPWKYSFNRLNGDLWIADVGQSTREEINKTTFPLPNTGLNYGWRCFEGTSVFNNSGCPTFANTVAPFTDYVYGSNGRCSITGGYFYTGSLYPNFANKYIFADYCTGEIGLVDASGVITWTVNLPGVITSFGEDVNGELYITNGTSVSKVVDTSLSALSLNESLVTIYPNPANNELYIKNDNNVALEFISIADLTGKIVFNQDIQNLGSNAVNIASLAKGMYLITVETQNGLTATSKIIKQ